MSSASFLKVRRPIVVIGAGGIVNSAHLPAYKIAAFDVAGIYDIKQEKAKSTAEKFSQHWRSNVAVPKK